MSHGDLLAGKAFDEFEMHHRGLACVLHRIHQRADAEDIPRKQEHNAAIACKGSGQPLRLRNRRDHRIFVQFFRNGVVHGRSPACFYLDYPGACAKSSPFPVDNRAAEIL